MKLVVAIIPPEKLERVQKALNNSDVHLMTVSEVLDCRHDHAATEIYRGRTIRRPAALEFASQVRVLDCMEESDAFLLQGLDTGLGFDCSGPSYRNSIRNSAERPGRKARRG
jgi:hypothetical protein